MKKGYFPFLFGTIILFVISCDLSDFQFDKLAKSADLNPVVYRPVSYGKYTVKDYTNVPGTGNALVTLDSLKFKTISYPLDSMAFNTAGTDSMVLIIKTINETTMRYRYKLSYKDGANKSIILDSGAKLLNPATLDAQGDLVATKDSLEYKLDSSAVAVLGAATQFDLSITLYKPIKGTVEANALRNAQITFYIGFRAPINVFKARL
jgi:hypothetical protein